MREQNSPVVVGGVVDCCMCRGGVKPSAAIQCEYCDQQFHLGCMKMPSVPNTARWYCAQCRLAPESGAWSLTSFETSTGIESQEKKKSKEVAKQAKAIAEEERAARAAKSAEIEKQLAAEAEAASGTSCSSCASLVYICA